MNADVLVLSALAFTLAVRHVKLLSLQPYPVTAVYKGIKTTRWSCHLDLGDRCQRVIGWGQRLPYYKLLRGRNRLIKWDVVNVSSHSSNDSFIP